MTKLLIAIDGPAGVGKTSVGLALASKYNLGFLSTGVMYRCLAWKVLQEHIDLSNEELVFKVAQNIQWGFQKQEDSSINVLVDGIYLGDTLLLEEVGQVASKTSALLKPRKVIMDKQKELALAGGLVMEGRDIGTVIAPFAPVKIYLTASAEARAKRRVLQLKEVGKVADYESILASIKERDFRDTNRKTSPLKPAEDAIIIDTSTLTKDEVIKKVLEITYKYAS